jgi:hypothetical protein
VTACSGMLDEGGAKSGKIDEGCRRRPGGAAL